MPLPPLTQVYTADAGAYLDVIDAMLDATGRLGDAIDAIAASADRLGVSLDTASGANDGLTEAITAATAVARDQIAAISELSGVVYDLGAAMEDATVATDQNTVALGENAGASRKSGESAAGFGATAKLAILGAGAAMVYSTVEAAKFQSTMTELLTQAGVAPSQFKALSAGVLQLAGQVGFSPDSLAEALYHVESSFASVGIKGPQALKLVQIAAQGAKVGHADLVDVTNALDAAIASGIPGVHGYSQAMGMLNAIVGSGDMHMQDLADAFGTGLLATVKGFGITLNDVGAALATFGDNNIRGAKAGTELRMAIQALGAPGTGPVAQAALAKLGLSYNTLSRDMQKGGLKLGIDDLAERMRKLGYTGPRVGEILTDAFGKKAGSGINILISQQDRFLSKYPDMAKGANDFGEAVKRNGETAGQQWAQLVASLQSLAVAFGTQLLPYAQMAIGALVKFLGWVQKTHGGVRDLAVIIGGILAVVIGEKLVHGVKEAKEAFEDLWGAGEKVVGWAGKIPSVASKVGSALKSGAELASSAWSGAADIVSNAWSSASEFVGNAASAAAGTVRELALGARMAVAQAGEMLSGLWSSIMEGAASAASSIAEFVSGMATQLAEAAADTAAWVAEHAAVAATYIGENLAMAASATAAFIAENLATLGIAAAIALLITAIVYLATHWHQCMDGIKIAALAVYHFLDNDVFHPIKDVIADVVGWIEGHWKLLFAILTGPIGLIVLWVRSHWTQMVNDVAHFVESVIAFFDRLRSDITDRLKALASDALGLGKNILMSIVHGFMSMVGWAVDQAKHVGSAIIDGFKDIFKIASPSRTMTAMGLQVVGGLVVGLQDGTPAATTAAQGTARQVTDAVASRTKIMTEIGVDLADSLVKGLTGTAAKVKSAADKIATLIKDAFSDSSISARTYTSLTSYIDRDNTRLQILADARQKILNRIKTAQAYAASTATSVEQSAGLANLNSVQNAQNGGPLYSGNIESDLQGQLAQIQQFGSALKQLSKLGLSKALIGQIVAMGPQQGLQVAQALISGPAAVIGQLNTTQSAITSASTALGTNAAEVMYDSGAQAGKGFLSGLQAAQSGIEAVMKKMAQTMVTTIRKELGIRSPSTVARYHGQMWGQGLAEGILDEEGRVSSASRRIAVALGAPGQAGVAAGAAAGGQPVVHFSPVINISGAVASDRAALQQLLFPVLQEAALQFNKRNGGTFNGLSLANARFA